MLIQLLPKLPRNGNTGKELSITLLQNVEKVLRINLDQLLTLFLQTFFEYVEECTTYDEVVEILTKLHVKTPNTVFTRHQLASRKQKPGENLDEFLEELKKLSKNCNFVAGSAEVYRSEMIRDSFINGLSSSYIRQRLLESAELTLEQAHDKARTLDLAQKNSEAYFQNTQPTVAAASTSEIIEPDSPESQ